MQAKVVTLQAGAITDEAWAPFGWLPVPDTDPADGSHTLDFTWGDPHLNVIAHAYDEVEHTDRGALCTRLYRHATHTQALMPLDHESIVAVAPAEIDFSDPAHLDAIRAFHVRPLDVFVLHRGTWHWGPFPLAPDPVHLLNVQGLRYADDNAHVDLADTTGAVVEVTA